MKHAITLSLTAGLAALWVGGCKVGPEYQQPQTSAPAAFHGLDHGSEAPSRLVPGQVSIDRWWTSLNDPTLESLLERSVAANLDLRLAHARLREARAQRGIVAADELPSVNAQAGYERGRSSENTQRGFQTFEPSEGSDLYRVGFDASWEIDLFGRVARSVEAADADVAAAIEDRNDVLVSLAAEVARTYVELRGFQRRVAVTEFAVQTERDSLDLVEARNRAGLATELDVAQAQSQLATRSSQLPPLRAGIKRSIHRLSILMGQEPGTLLEELTPVAAIPTVPPEIAVGVPAELLRRRPDIRRAERQVAAATARVGVATADLYPRFTLLGFFGFESDHIGDLIDANSRRWAIGPSMSWPIFDGGRVRSTINVRNAQLDQSLFTYEKAVLNAYEEVENSMVSFIQEQARRAALAAAAESSDRAVALARERYQSGLVDFLNVLDSQRLLYQAQDQLALSEQSVTVEVIALYKALGGGWEPPPDASAQQDAASASAPADQPPADSPAESNEARPG